MLEGNGGACPVVVFTTQHSNDLTASSVLFLCCSGADITEAVLKKGKAALGKSYVKAKGKKHPECGWAAIILPNPDPTQAEIDAAKLLCIQWSEENLPPAALLTPPPRAQGCKRRSREEEDEEVGSAGPIRINFVLESPGLRAGAAALARVGPMNKDVVPGTPDSA